MSTIKAAKSVIFDSINKVKDTVASEKSVINNEVESISFDIDNIKLDDLDYSNIRDKDAFTPQGYTTTNEGYVLISAYKKGEKSRVYVYDKEGNYIGYIILENKAHVGGMSLDTTNNVLFVTGSDGVLNAYDYSKLLPHIENASSGTGSEIIVDLNSKKTFIDNMKLNCDISIKGLSDANIASVYEYDGKVYCTTFGRDGKLFVFDYSVNNGEIKNNSVKKYDIGPAVQGLSAFSRDGSDYILVSRSSGVNLSSLTLYSMKDGKLEFAGDYIVPQSGLEGIDVDNDGNISGVFEYETQKVSLICNFDQIKGNHSDLNTKAIVDIENELAGIIWDSMKKT